MSEPEKSAQATNDKQSKGNLPPAAQRALAEAQARRQAAAPKSEAEKSAAQELGGRDGPDPARYGDWEVKGLASDF
ncbi:MAG: DUF1674 domain-containing protein [Methylocystis sp.]|nr:MAG: DUF1674 domain-containing protein [Methylocystis sp.]